MLDEKNLENEELQSDEKTSEEPVQTTEAKASEPTAEKADTSNDDLEDSEEVNSDETNDDNDTEDASDEGGSDEEVIAVEEGDEELVLEEEVFDDTPHDDFDWDRGNLNELPYSEEQIEQYLSQYEETLNSVGQNEIVKGKVTSMGDGDVVLDISSKSDGLVSLSEFRDTPDLDVGDYVEVYVEQQEDERGQLVLSRRKAKLLRAWENIVDSYNNGTIIKGTIISKTKGGLIVDCNGLETFLPGSQIDIRPIIDYDSYVGKTMEFKVVKINEQIKNAVVSHKALIESDLAEQREAIIASLEKGQVLEGLVKNLTDFGAFLDLGGVDGLLYITDISWGRINHPSEILELNQKINVVVLDFDEDKKRISLGLKQLQPHPWDVLGDDITEGATIKGKIVNVEDYGGFLELKPGVEGLIHVSEVTWSNQPINARDYFVLGQEYEAKIVTIDREDRKMSLSIKQLSKDPWSDIEERYPVGSRHSGEVKNLTPYGVFVELEEGIGGMIHISDLSWTKRYGHPSEFTRVGDNIEIMILDFNKDSRKLSLGHKQLEENPWDTFQAVFPVGSYHEATILRRDDRGAIVQLPYGLEAYAPIKHVRKEDGTLAEVEEALTVKVIEFNRDDKRILVSHLRYLDDIRREADASVRKEREEERRQTRKTIKSQASKNQQATLGELDAFSQLKEQMREQAEQELAARQKAKKEEAAAKAEETPKKEKEATAKAEAPKKKEEASAKAEETPKKEEEASAKAEETPKKEEEASAKAEETPKKKEEATAKAEETPKKEEEASAKAEETPKKKEEATAKAEETPKKEEEASAKAEETPKKEEEASAKAEETPKKEEKAPAAEKTESDAKAEDYKVIEGIGPKIEELLHNAGFHTYDQLANADAEKLKEVLSEAGSRYRMHDPSTWPEQSKMASEGKWDALKELQDELQGGKKA